MEYRRLGRTALRVSELCALDRKDFDYQNLLLKLKGKGKKERLVPITQKHDIEGLVMGVE